MLALFAAGTVRVTVVWFGLVVLRRSAGGGGETLRALVAAREGKGVCW